MSNYIIEGNINFKEELCKMIDYSSDDDTTLCQITGLPLNDLFVKMECGHQFNYEPLYHEIYKQKYVFKTYTDIRQLNKKSRIKIRESNLDYFIMCPYCRNVQFTLLPYYAHLGLELKYGINTDLTEYNSFNNHVSFSKKHNYSFVQYGNTFSKGYCKFINNCGDECIFEHVAKIPNTELSYCKTHYREGLKNHYINEKQKIAKEKEKEKENKLIEDKKLLEEKNNERIAKGIVPLKRLVNYNFEDGCKQVLKSGLNKGKQCGCQKIEQDGLCKRHVINITAN